MPRRKSSGPDRDSATIVAAVGVLASALALLGFTAIVLPNVLALVGLVVAIGLFALMHYVVWGRWLTKKLAESDEPEKELDER